MLKLESQIKMEEICFCRFLKMGKDSAAGLSWAGHSTRWEQLMKKSVLSFVTL